MPARSASETVCRTAGGSIGSTVTAKRVFNVLAGGSPRCAWCAASTSPVSASATSHDRAERSRGTPGTPGRGRTWVPGRSSGAGGGLAVLGVGPVCALPAPMREPVEVTSAPPRATAGPDVRASAPTTQSAEQETAVRAENPIVIPPT